MPTSPGSSSRPFRTSVTAARAAWALGAASALLLTLVVTRWGPLLAVDEAVARATHGWAVGAPGPTSAARILSDWVWDPWTMRLICAVVVVWSLLRWRDRRLAVWLTLACVLGSLAQLGLKAAVGRARPVWTDPVDSAEFAAFPSGHAMTATFVCGLLLRVLRRRGARPGVRRAALAVASVSVVGVGLTRVWLGVHWASDVVAGWSFGALVVAVAVLVDRRRAIRPGWRLRWRPPPRAWPGAAFRRGRPGRADTRGGGSTPEVRRKRRRLRTPPGGPTPPPLPRRTQRR